MSPSQCLLSPHHFTHLGVCYPGSDASFTISDPNHPQTVHFTVGVPEPGTLWLMVPAVVFGLILRRGHAKAT